MVIEGSAKIRGNVGVDVLVEIEFVLGYLSDGLFLLDQIEDHQVGVVEPGIFEGLSYESVTKSNLWVLWSW